MNNMLVLPLLLPLCTAAILLVLKNQITLQRWISAVSVLINIVITAMIVLQVKDDGIQTLHMGGWLPPYGIVFVADMLAALLVLVTMLVTFFCLLYAFTSIGEERERHYFYPFVQFLLAGVSGSFLTGDLFNLFVCFEVMLISSYALIVLGGTKDQLQESIKYMLINILSSALFVASVAYLYGAVGTLNMAHLSVRIAEAGQGGILNVIAMLFMVVFSLKAGLFLFFWLPGSYRVPPPAVMALFGALLSKVGLYALIRTFTLIFYSDTAATHTWLAAMGGITMVLGAIGALAYQDIRKIINYNVIISVGFIAFGLAVMSKESLDGAVFYLLHDMLAKSLLFILGGIIIGLTGTHRLDEMGGLIKRYPAVSWMLFIAVLAVAGIPPLSGFTGKLLIIEGGFTEQRYWLAAISLASSLIVMYSLIRIFMKACWGEEKGTYIESPTGRRSDWLAALPAACLTIIVIVMGLGSEWVYSFVSVAGETLIDPSIYIEAVLKG